MSSFEWDEKKNRANQAKHGISFEAARACWDGPMLVSEDTRFTYGEARSIALALLGLTVVVVAYTERGNNIRIISVRKAARHEQEIFYASL